MMNVSKFTLGLALLSLTALTSCGGSQQSATSQDSLAAQADSLQSPAGIPFRLADRYFAASDSLPSTITSEEELNRYLGMATTMDARPTEIDFAKEFVIPIALPSTSISTEIRPLELKKDDEGKLVLSYEVLEGEDLKTSQMRPFAAVIVSRDYLAPVTLVAVK